MNTINKFDGRAENYTVSRPSYSIELINYLYNASVLSKESVIADIGSGTGKLSRLLLDMQSKVYCVEPNNDMRLIAEAELCSYQSFHSVVGDAEHTTLENDFVDCVTAAQSFHWFDTVKFKRECIRITKSHGKAVLVWNVRDCEDERNAEWHSVFSLFCPSFKGFSNGLVQDDERIKLFFDKGCEYAAFDHPLIFDRDNFIKRSLSSSYSLQKGDKDYEKYIFSLNELFDRYETNGYISIPNRSVAYIGTVR